MGDASFASILHLCQTTSLSISWQILILCMCVWGGGLEKAYFSQWVCYPNVK